MQTNNKNELDERVGTGFGNVLKSTIAAACGVQTQANRERDFKQGKPSTFVIAGVLFVLVFIAVMYTIVQIVLSLATT